MRHLIFICRPCLASIRKQHGQALSGIFAFRATVSPISRWRKSTFTTLHALRSETPTPKCRPSHPGTLLRTAKDDSPSFPTKPPDRIDLQDFPQAFAEEMEKILYGSGPGVAKDTKQQGHKVSRADSREAHDRSPEEEWDEVEATLFGSEDSAKSREWHGTNGRSVDDALDTACAAEVDTRKTSDFLSSLKTTQGYLRAIDRIPELKLNRMLRETRIRDRFALCLAAYNQKMHLNDNFRPLVLDRSRRCADIETMKEKWRGLSPLSRDRRWPGLVMRCIESWPEGLPQLLQATVEPDIARPYMLKDLLKLMGMRVKHYRGEDRQVFADSVVMSLVHILQTIPRGSIDLYQITIFRIMNYASTPRVFDLYVELREWEWSFTRDTKMQFASHFAKDVAYKLHGVELFQEIVQMDKLDINSIHGAALATSLLAIQNEPDGIRDAPPPEDFEKIFEILLDLGLNPNLINLTSIIQTLCESKQLAKAWEVSELLIARGYEPDEQFFSVMLHGSKISSDYVSAQRVIEMVRERRIHNRQIWNSLLHTVYMAALREAIKQRATRGRQTPPIFSTMCYVYNKLYEQGPLQRFMITNIEHHTLKLPRVETVPPWLWPFVRHTWPIISRQPNYPRIQPGSDTIYIMLVAYIKGFSKPGSIIAFYNHFQYLLKSGDPITVQFVEETGPKLHNLILMALCAHRFTLRFALVVLDNMIKDNAEMNQPAAGEITEEDDEPPRHPPPDVRSWGIILNGFMRHKRFVEGEAMFNLMRKFGIPQEMPSWNIMLAGYIRAGKMSKARDVLVRMHKAGLVPDEFTTKILDNLPDNNTSSVEILRLLDRMNGQGQGQLMDAEDWLEEKYYDNVANADAVNGDDHGQSGNPRQGPRHEYEQLEAELKQDGSSYSSS